VPGAARWAHSATPGRFRRTAAVPAEEAACAAEGASTRAPGRREVRNVPDELQRRLKARAALAGMSLSDFLLEEARRAVDRPTPAMPQRESAAPRVWWWPGHKRLCSWRSCRTRFGSNAVPNGSGATDAVSRVLPDDPVVICGYGLHSRKQQQRFDAQRLLARPWPDPGGVPGSGPPTALPARPPSLETRPARRSRGG
jgi:hypothetical protein